MKSFGVYGAAKQSITMALYNLSMWNAMNGVTSGKRKRKFSKRSLPTHTHTYKIKHIQLNENSKLTDRRTDGNLFAFGRWSLANIADDNENRIFFGKGFLSKLFVFLGLIRNVAGEFGFNFQGLEPRMARRKWCLYWLVSASVCSALLSPV